MIDPNTEDQAIADAPPSMSQAIAETAIQIGNYGAPLVHALDASAKAMTLQEPAPTPEPFEPPSQMADALRKSAEGMFNQSRQELNASIFQATSKNPDEEAAAQKLGAATGVGSGIALRNKDELERRKAMNDARNLDLTNNNPALANKLIADPQFAAVAHDDLSWWDKYGKLAHSVMFPLTNPAWFAESVMQTSMGKAFAGGMQVPQITELQREQALSPNGILPPEREQQLQALEAQQAQTQQETGGMLNTPASMAGNIVGMGESLANFTSAGGLVGGTAGLLGGPFAEVTVPGGIIAGATFGFSGGMAAEFSKQAMYSNYRQSRLQGIPHEQALSNARIVGFANSVFFAGAIKLIGAPIGAAISSLAAPVTESVVVPTAKAILLNYVKAYSLHEVGAFGLGAGLKASEIGAAKISGIKTTEGTMNIAEEILTSGAHTAYDFALLNALFPLLPAAAQYGVLKESEMRQAKFKAKIKSVAENNKTKKRSPEQMQNGIESVTPESEQFVYVDKDQLSNVLMQSGASANEIEQILPGVLAQLKAENPEIAINSAHYLANEVASTKIGKALEPNLRMEKGGLSPNEILQQNIDANRVRAESKAAVEQYAKMNAGFVESAQKVEDLYFNQLVAAGYKEQEARFHAAMIRDYYAVIAAREKKTPEQVHAERPYTVVSEQQARERQAAQSAQQAQAKPFVPKVYQETTVTPEQTASLSEPLAAAESELNDAKTSNSITERGGKQIGDSLQKLKTALARGKLGEIGAQTWKLLERLKENLGMKAAAELASKTLAALTKLGVEFYDPTGTTYTEGWVEVEIVSWLPYKEGVSKDKPFVEKVISPIVRRNGEIIQRGQVVVREGRIDHEEHLASQAKDAEIQAKMQSELDALESKLKEEGKTDEAIKQLVAERKTELEAKAREERYGKEQQQAPAQGSFEQASRADLGLGEQAKFDEASQRPEIVTWAKEKFGDRTAPDGSSVWQNFTEWFGDSKVVDAEGKPMMAYHATHAKENFTEFKAGEIGIYGRGIYFSTSIEEINQQYLGLGYNRGRIVPAYLFIKNPLITTHNKFEQSVADALKIDENQLSTIVRNRISKGELEKDIYTNLIKESGHDGVEIAFPGRESYFVAFEPTQIKSAIANVGTFGQQDPNILRQELSTRRPSSVTATEDPLTTLLTISHEQTLRTPEVLAKNVEILKKLTPMRFLDENATPEQQLENFLAQASDNLVALYNLMPPELRERAKLWYPGGRRMLDYISSNTGLSPMQVGGVFAVLSPQKDWYENVTLGNRIIDIVTTQSDFVWDEKMSATAAKLKEVARLAAEEAKVLRKAKAEIALTRAGGLEAMVEQPDWNTTEEAQAELEKEAVKARKVSDRLAKAVEKSEDQEDSAAMKLYDDLKGTTLKELLSDPYKAAVWVRVFDQTFNEQSYKILLPEGGVGETRTTQAGKESSLRWAGYGAVAKAISVIVDGRAENVFYQIGNEHKVRNFYNNLFAPESGRYITIDTHAVAAANFMPLAGTDDTVAHAFGGSAASGETGQSGAYSIYFESYRRAAEAVGVLPREMQSITWEAVRGLFEASKKKTFKPLVKNIWEKYKSGELTQEQAREEIIKLVGGITNPSWAASAYNESPGQTYEGVSAKAASEKSVKVKTIQKSEVLFEVAPDPTDANLSSRWDTLDPETKHGISADVAAVIVPEVLKEFGVSGEIIPQVGGWQGKTNPGFALRLESGPLTRQVAKALGHALSQQGMFSISAEKFEGSQESGLISIQLPEGYTEKQVGELYEKLWELKHNGKQIIQGHTTIDGKMSIINDTGIDTTELGDMIDKHLGGAFKVTDTKANTAFDSKDTYDTNLQRPAPRGVSILGTRRIDSFREQATRLIDQEVARAEEAAGKLSQSAVPATFYSALSVEVGKSTTKSASADSWKQQIKGLIAKGVVKEKEVYWSGLNNWLDLQEGKITKEQVQAFLDAGGVKVKVVRLDQDVKKLDRSVKSGTAYAKLQLEENGMLTPKLESAFAELEQLNATNLDPDRRLTLHAIIDNVLVDVDGMTLNQYIETENSVSDPSIPSVRYEAYQLPGGTNYREALVTLPRREKTIPEIEKEMGFVRPLTNEQQDKVLIQWKQHTPSSEDFQTSHWNEPNILVHLRMNDRVDADGKKVLFVEEVQSDWGQAGREKGFVNETQIEIEKLEKQQAQAESDAEPYTSQGKDAPTEIADRWNFAANRLQALRSQEVSSVPTAPFVETTSGWLELGLKQILLEAVNGKYDRVAFVDGDQNVQRYRKALTEAVDEVEITRNDDGTYTYNAIKNGAPVQGEQSVSANRINEVFGKAGSKQLLEEADANPDEIHTIASGDIEIGGEGMRKFYDTIVPQALGKMLKKLGGDKVGEVEIDTRRPEDNAYYADLTEADTMRQQGFTVTPALAEQVSQGLPLFQAAEGPPAGKYDPAKMLTTIMKSGNKSTLIHETAHFFLHMAMETAAKEGSSLEAQQDAQILLDWFGVKDIATWNAMTLDEQRQHHEAFALNWEIYVHEGKAPSVGLQKVFDAFSRYLKRVYVSIITQLNEVHRKNFGVDLPSLTPEVKGVMDRMLANDAQILQREAIDNIKAQWETQEESGMNDGEWAALKEMEREAHDQAESDLNKASLKQVEWLTKATERLNTQAMMEFKRLRKTVSAEETAKMEKEPLRQAENFLKTGKMLDADGNEIEVAEGFKLDKSAVGVMYPTSTTGLTPAVDLTKLRGMTMDGGLAPDLVAEMFGLSSGDELIRKLVDQKPFKDELQERTNARMEDEHGDLNTEEARQDAVNQALHNELRARYIAVQNRFRNKIKTPVAQLMIAVKERAQEILAKMKLKDIRPTEFSSAEAREAKTQQDAHKAMQTPEKASKTAYTRSYNEQIAAGVEEAVAVAAALEKGKAAAEKAQAKIDAHKEKYGDVMPEMVARKAGDLQELYNRLAKDAFDIKDSISRFVKYTKNVLSDDSRKRMGADASEQIEGILSRFGLVPPGKEPKMTLGQWVTAQTDKGLPPDIAPKILDQSYSISFSEMTVEEFADLKDAVKYIEHVSKYESKAMKAARNKSFADFVPMVVKSVLEQNPRLIPFARRTARTGTEKANKAVAEFGLGQQRGGMMIRILDGDKDGGIVSGFLLHTMDTQTGVESEFVTKTTKVLDALIQPVLAEGKMGGSGELFPNLKSDAFPNGRPLNKEERLAIALNCGNESNLQRLLGGERWTMDQIVPILRTLTDADWNFVEGVWDHFETYKPMVAELERKLNGKEPDWIEPKPFEIKTADGTTRTIKGGYYPVKFDPAAGPQAKIFEDVKDVKSASYAAHGAATTRRGYVKARVEEVHDKPLLLNMNGMYSGFAEVIHDLAWREWLIDANRFMANKEIDKAIRDKYGAPFVDGIRDWIKRIAGGTNSDNVGGVFNFFRHKAVASTMAWKVATLWKHAFDISKTASILGADKGPIEGWKYVFNAAGDVFSNYNEAIKEAFANSPELRHRFNTRFRELNEIKNAVAGQSKFDKFMYTHGLILHHMLWKVTDVWTWKAAAKKYIANGFTNEEAYAMANRALIDSQGSGTVGNLSAVEGTRSPALKLFTALSHYMINTSNILYVKTKTRTPGAAGTAKLVANYLQAVTVPVIYEELMRHAIIGLLPNKKKKKEEETAGSIMKEFSMAHADYLLGSVPIAREMSSGIKEMFGVKTAGYQGPFGLKIIPDTILFARQMNQKEFDAEFRRAAIRLLGDGTGFPASQLNSTIDGIEALFKGETMNPLAPILGTRH